MRGLHYGRIRLDAHASPIRVDPGALETGLVCLQGSGRIRVGIDRFDVQPYDAVYVPRDSHFLVSAGPSGLDMAEVNTPVEGRYVARFVPFDEVRRDPRQHWRRIGPAGRRNLHIVLGETITAGRLILGLSFGDGAGAEAWQPVAHVAVREEAYLGIDMPESRRNAAVDPDHDALEDPPVVREGDMFLRPNGARPRFVAAGSAFNILWVMIVQREVGDRQLGLMRLEHALPDMTREEDCR
jgi:5-deoxy-D-glucuronate isomerase